ncbi:UNKNOWN [Stylonychia lemnae]|uniref:Uncharacterized protein n=1 Tax=Stylonychia lemnae TaxID=5949 RepID=A0A077ZRV1_STYLE|nr:UNKNOWN [Stylonychia lemnae]|eukprot:CDW72204.1 UNKNOWN [Stylonychia lemnae]
MIDWVKKRYHNQASSKYTVTNNEIKQQEGLKKLFKMFADPQTNQIKVERNIMRKLRHQKQLIGDLQFLALPSDFCSLLFTLSQLLQRDNIVNELSDTSKLDLESVTKQTQSFVNLFQQDQQYLENNENDKVVSFVIQNIEKSLQHQQSNIGKTLNSNSSNMITMTENKIGRSIFRNNLNQINEEEKLETESTNRTSTMLNLDLPDKILKHSYSTKNINRKKISLPKQNEENQKTMTVSTLPAISSNDHSRSTVNFSTYQRSFLKSPKNMPLPLEFPSKYPYVTSVPDDRNTFNFYFYKKDEHQESHTRRQTLDDYKKIRKTNPEIIQSNYHEQKAVINQLNVLKLKKEQIKEIAVNFKVKNKRQIRNQMLQPIGLDQSQSKSNDKV